MEQKEAKVELSDAELAVELLKARVVNEVQLKAAIDYQESIGGRLRDVLVKLGLVREQKLDDFLERLENGDGTEAAGDRAEPLKSGGKLRPTPEILAGLRLHRKLLEKVPEDTRRQYGVLLFFPPPGTRAILLSGRPEPPEGELERLRAILGIELQRLDLSSDERRPFLASVPKLTAAGTSKKKKKNGARSPSNEKAGREGVELLDGLISLLVRKNVITREELKVELQLLKRRRD